MSEFPFCKQLDAMDCGPACLQMIARHYGKHYLLSALREKSGVTREGVSLRGIKAAAQSIGMQARGVQATLSQLARASSLPCIVHWKQRHFVVVYQVSNQAVSVADPEQGLLTYDQEEFIQHWSANRGRTGVALLLKPTAEFFKQQAAKNSIVSGWQFLRPYLTPYRVSAFYLLLGLLLGSAIQLALPFLSQMLVDVGIGQRNLHFMTVVLAAQLMLFASRTGIDMLRRRMLLRLGTRLHVALLSDFLQKLMRLPLGFFDSKTLGDLLQRIDDHDRIEDFLTTSTLSVLFSLINLIVFSAVLAWYNLTIFSIFLIGSVCYVLWGSLFLGKRRRLDFVRFDRMSEHQSKLLDIINGIRDIKVSTCDAQQQQEWAAIQEKLFKTNVDALTLSQFQEIGMTGINQLQNIVITFLSVKAVLDGSMTLGMVLAVQYMLGQLQSPVEHLIEFFQVAQDAAISLERIQEIHEQRDEEPSAYKSTLSIPKQAVIRISHAAFRYGGEYAPPVFDDVSLHIPAGKITAIVGPSGSGKTTLLKLLLGFYQPTQGGIYLDNTELSVISPRTWRSRCGVVMQDGFVFANTIAGNIALGNESINLERVRYASDVACIRAFIESLPAGYNTHIGDDGVQISQGQKQRLLIARAVYKNPDYLFFDEATNALDAEHETRILEQLHTFFQGRTVVVAAHRLSTIRQVDQIAVLDSGRIVEIGTHDQLIRRKGRYYQLMHDQLEPGFPA